MYTCATKRSANASALYINKRFYISIEFSIKFSRALLFFSLVYFEASIQSENRMFRNLLSENQNRFAPSYFQTTLIVDGLVLWAFGIYTIFSQYQLMAIWKREKNRVCVHVCQCGWHSRKFVFDAKMKMNVAIFFFRDWMYPIFRWHYLVRFHVFWRSIYILFFTFKCDSRRFWNG